MADGGGSMFSLKITEGFLVKNSQVFPKLFFRMRAGNRQYNNDIIRWERNEIENFLRRIRIPNKTYQSLS